jgi:hypothetical protein
MSLEVLTLKEALDKPSDTTVSVPVQILKISDIISYTAKDMTERKYFRCDLADPSTYSTIRVYSMKHQTICTEGASLLLQNILRKTGDAAFWVVSTSNVSMWAPIDVSETIRESAKQSKSTDGQTVNLCDAIKSSSSSNVIGKVVQVKCSFHWNLKNLHRFIKLQ